MEADASTLERILSEARREFLERGYQGASLRGIVKRAGVTTGAFYGYFPDKQALFQALVQPAAQGLTELFTGVLRRFQTLPPDAKLREAYTYSLPHQRELVDYIYDHVDAFRLLISCAGGTQYADFINDLVAAEAESTADFVTSTGLGDLCPGRVTPQLTHILSSAFVTAVFEMVAHDMPRQEAHRYMDTLRIFFAGGWKALLAPD